MGFLHLHMDKKISDFAFESLLKRNDYTVDRDGQTLLIRKGNGTKSLRAYKIGAGLLLFCGLVALVSGLIVPAGILLFTAIPLAIRMMNLSKISSTANKQIKVSPEYIEITSSKRTIKIIEKDWYSLLRGESVKDVDFCVGYIFAEGETEEDDRIMELFGENEKHVLDDLNLVLRYLYQCRDYSS